MSQKVVAWVQYLRKEIGYQNKDFIIPSTISDYSQRKILDSCKKIYSSESCSFLNKSNMSCQTMLL